MYSVGSSRFTKEASLTLRDETWLFVSSQFALVKGCTSGRVSLRFPAATSHKITPVGLSVGPFRTAKHWTQLFQVRTTTTFISDETHNHARTHAHTHTHKMVRQKKNQAVPSMTINEYFTDSRPFKSCSDSLKCGLRKFINYK